MGPDIIAAAVTALIGFAVAFVNFLISKHILIRHPQKYAFTTVLRQALQVIFLVAVFFIAQKLQFNLYAVLIAAVFGITVPMLLFTKKLIKINDDIRSDKKPKEDETNG